MKSKSMFMIVAIIAVCIMTGCKKEQNPALKRLVPKTIDQDPAIPGISINGIQLHAETYGNPDSAMVIFLHGGPGGDYRNAMQVKQLADNGYYVVFYDQRGSGLSQRQDGSRYSPQVMIDDLAGVIQHYRRSPAQKIFLFGHSWGAMLATAFINAYPTAINGVILAEPGGFTWEEAKAYGEKSRKLALFSEAVNDVMYQDQFLTGMENEHEVLDYKRALSAAFTYATGNAEGIDGPSPYWRYGAVVHDALFDIGKKEGFDFTTHLSQYQTKVLFLYGEYNKAYGLAAAAQQAHYFKSSQIVKVAGTGHEMVYFKWDLVYPVVLNYLNTLK